jgi:hypothetical protein
MPDKRSAMRVPQHCDGGQYCAGQFVRILEPQREKMNEYADLAEFQSDKLDVARRN